MTREGTRPAMERPTRQPQQHRQCSRPTAPQRRRKLSKDSPPPPRRSVKEMVEGLTFGVTQQFIFPLDVAGDKRNESAANAEGAEPPPSFNLGIDGIERRILRAGAPTGRRPKEIANRPTSGRKELARHVGHDAKKVVADTAGEKKTSATEASQMPAGEQAAGTKAGGTAEATATPHAAPRSNPGFVVKRGLLDQYKVAVRRTKAATAAIAVEHAAKLAEVADEARAETKAIEAEVEARIRGERSESGSSKGVDRTSGVGAQGQASKRKTRSQKNQKDATRPTRSSTPSGEQ